MDLAAARSVAHYSHVEQRDRHGEPVIEHVARIAAAVPAEAAPIAWLHEVLEWSPTTRAELRANGFTADEEAVLELLTRRADESYELYVLRIAYAQGPEGRLARVIKLADLDDRIARRWSQGDPPYAWARRHIAVAHGQLGFEAIPAKCAVAADRRGSTRLAAGPWEERALMATGGPERCSGA